MVPIAARIERFADQCYRADVQELRVKSDRISDDNTVFARLASAYSEFAKEAGVTVVPYRDPKLPLFVSLPEAIRRDILGALSLCVKICEQTRGEGHSMSNSPALMWAALKEFGLRPPSDLFGHIDGLCVLEVHSSEGIQIFRNFAFYKYCSYSLEELYTTPWFHLFERDEAITSQMIELATKVFSGEIKHTVPMDLPLHEVRERHSPRQNRVKLDMRWIAPLFHPGGKPEATIVVETITPMKSLMQDTDVQPARTHVEALLHLREAKQG
jgi:hypothetical protein